MKKNNGDLDVRRISIATNRSRLVRAICQMESAEGQEGDGVFGVPTFIVDGKSRIGGKRPGRMGSPGSSDRNGDLREDRTQMSGVPVLTH